MANRLFKKTGIYFIGNFSSKLISAIIVPIYAIFVSSSDLGDYDYLLTLTQIIAPIVYLAIWEAILKFSIEEKENIDYIIATAVRFCVPLAFVSVILVACVSLALSYPLLNIFALCIMIISYSLARIWQYASRGLGKSKDYAWSGIISSFVFFAGVIVLVCLAKTGLTGLFVSYVLGQLSIVFYLEKKCSLLPRSKKRKLDISLLRDMLHYSIPCISNLVALNLLVGFGRIATINFLGSEANGQYAFAMKFATVVTSIGSIFSMAVIEEGIIRSSSSKLSEFYSVVTNSLLIILFSVISILMPCVYLFYILISSTEYAGAAELTPGVLLYAALTVMATQFGSIFMAINKTRSIATTTIFGLIITVVLTLLTINSLGLSGVILGLCVGTAAMTISRCLFAKKYLSFTFYYRRSVALLVAYIFESLVCLQLYERGYYIGLILVTCLLSVFYLPFAVRAINKMRKISDYERN